MKSASESVAKWQNRTAAASQDYIEGAAQTDKDQAARAIASKEVYKAALNASFGRDSYAKGLSRSGKQGWLNGVQEKGAQNFATGAGSNSAREKYVANSSKYDSARRAADNLPRGPRGSAGNIARVTAVATALNAVRVGR